MSLAPIGQRHQATKFRKEQATYDIMTVLDAKSYDTPMSKPQKKVKTEPL